MFERFTDRARRSVVLAQHEARLLNHNYIGTEHILLGLVQEGEGVAAKALESLDISLKVVRRKVEQMIGRGEAPPAGHIPFTPRAKKVLELSLREALQLGHNYIGTEHILLGLIRLGEGVAAEALQELGADLNRVRQTVIQLLSGYTGGEGETRPSGTEEEVMHREVFARRKVPAEDFPICPNCSAALAETASVKIRELAMDDEPPQTIKIAYCGGCGITLGIKIV